MIPQFVNPMLLWGLAAASVPIVIHLLNRRRYRVQRWAAMEWLLAAARKNQKRLKMENLLLLLLRTCAVLFLALAIARPTFSDTALSLDKQAAHLFILLDNSASTGARTGAGTALESEISSTLSLLGEIGADDPVTLVLTNDESSGDVSRKTGRARVVLNGTRNHSNVRQLISEMKPAAARGDLVDALQKLEEAVPSRGPVVAKVAIVTDLQKTGLDGGDAKGGATPDSAVRSTLERLKQKGAEVVIVAPGRPAGNNVAITSLRAQDDRDIVRGASVAFEAEVRNFGDRPVRAEVRFLLDGKERGDVVQNVALAARPSGSEGPPAGTVQYVVTFREGEEGVHILEARISADSLAVDDVRTFAFEVRKPIRVLAVDGDPKGSGRSEVGETYFLTNTLAIKPGGPIDVQTFDEGQFEGERDLASWDLVILANVEHPARTPEVRRRLDEYVRNGGALFLTVGDRVVADVWNTELRGTAPLLPAELDAPRIDPTRTTTLRFDLSENRHPILKDITNPAMAAFFRSPPIWGRMTLRDGAAENGTRVVMTYRNLDEVTKAPALIERSVGKGRVLLLTTTVDDAWGKLAGDYLYPALLHETVYYLTSHGNAERNLLTYQLYSRPLPANVAGVEVTAPDGSPVVPTTEQPVDALPYFTVETPRPGAYRMTVALKPADILSPAPPPVRDAFAVNVTPAESDLERLRPEDVESRWPGLVRLAQGFGNSPETARPKGGEFHAPLLILSILCLIAEAFLVRRIAKTRAQGAGTGTGAATGATADAAVSP